MFEFKNAANIKNVENLSKKKKKRLKIKKYEDLINSLEKYEVGTIVEKDLEFAFAFPLEHSATQDKSHLNKYFARGRLNSKSGIITPRPWYEVELISSISLISEPDYPKGPFTAYTDDGFVIPMKTSGANKKNIESKGSLQLFGAWIKGKMEQVGALEVFQPFDLDVLESYGVKELKFYKIKNENFPENSFYLEF